ncbi:MAG: hypothetical protein QM675_07930 [Protaetiibacter sp.]
MRRRERLAALAVAMLVGLGIALPATPAAAVLYPIGLSSDGTSFSPTFPGSLFSGVTIVPGGAVTRSFWVKNNETSAGNLAVAIRSVGSADAAFAAALSATAVAGGSSGSARFADAEPCVSLVHGVRIASGRITRVDVTLSLSGDLTGHEAQQAIAAFDLFVTLTSTGVRAPDGCTRIVASSGGDETASDDDAASAIVPGAGTADATLSPTPAPSGDASPEAGGDDAVTTWYWNSDRFYQEYVVAWWLVAFLLGGAFAWWRDRRRERIAA